MYRNIVAAYDGSEGARAALERAAELAGAGDAALTVVQAASDEAGARHSLEEAIGSLDASLEASPWVAGTPPADAILAVARDIHADLIVTASRGRGRVERTLLGSVSSELVHGAACDVLVVHPPGE